ncbi:MAG: rane protein of unknown function [Planctomycetaceae bacterium]|nr:rane protein of unknown function [Planctomycetaceae bacterium]
MVGPIVESVKVFEGSKTERPLTKLQGIVARIKFVLPRLALFLFVFVIALKCIDVLWGVINHTPQRYLLPLYPNFRQRHVSSEFDYEFRTNSLGLRGPEIALEKPSRTFRIVVLGDSFVAGNGVAEAEAFPKRLEADLNGTAPQAASHLKFTPPTEVINVGCTGVSTVRAVDLYESLGKQFHPDLVILAYYVGNDLTGVVQEQTPEEFKAWRPQGVLRRSVYWLAPNFYLEWKLRRPAATVMGQILRTDTASAFPNVLHDLANAAGYDGDLVTRRYQAIPGEIRHEIETGQLSEHRVLLACLDPAAQRQAIFPTADFFALAWPRTVMHLDQLRSAAGRDGARFALVIIPTASQVDRKALEFNRKLGYEVDTSWLTEECTTTCALMNWAKERGIAALDLTQPFRKAHQQLYFPKDTHLTPAGHSRLAELLDEFLKQHDLLGG